MDGRGSLAGLLPFGDANDIVLQMANEVLPVVKGVPVLAGVCATDPFRRMEYFLRQLETIGFCGVQNFPTVGLFDGNFRHNLEETGMGYNMEVEMISMAHRMGFLTTPYAFNPDEAAAMAKAGAHIIVAHMGLTTAGSIRAMTAATLDDSVLCVQAIADAAFGVKLISLFSITEFLMFPRELQLLGESVKLMKLVEAVAKGTINNETLGYFT
ncbi:TIM-barrel signal transduction protein isoform 2 [Zea mays]|uniref:TIM-barrel signal transduction protein isoform 2 n=1 Tax=Zea mays TaxID=4577 RepID=A0A1D6MLW1_MAIZE|nr:TIM-barrel signal transduction protein isoform 2 [Zea mays]